MKIRYYSSFNEDFAFQRDLDPGKISRLGDSTPGRVSSAALYRAAVLFGRVYARLFRGLKAVGGEKLRGTSGAFIYGNHTHALGDVFIPLVINSPARVKAVVSRQNLAIPLIGKLIVKADAVLPLPEGVKELRNFSQRVTDAAKSGRRVLIYPEAHVWDYCTFIRPFPETSFTYPALCGEPVFVFTSTYRKRRLFRSPGTTLFVDGPLRAPQELSAKKRALWLSEKTAEIMRSHADANTQEYIKYVPEEK